MYILYIFKHFLFIDIINLYYNHNKQCYFIFSLNFIFYIKKIFLVKLLMVLKDIEIEYAIALLIARF